MNPSKTKVTKINRENLSWLFEQPMDIKVGLLTQHLSIAQIVINQIMEEEVNELSGERYSRDKPGAGNLARWGFNPGSVRIGEKKVKVEIPRIYNLQKKKNVSLESYAQLKQLPDPDEQIMHTVMHGISTRDYAGVIDYLQESFGLSKSTVSERFIEASTEKLKEFESRDLAHHDLIALFIDGKYLAKEQIIIVMGITINGDKIPLGFLQSNSEKSGPIKALFESLKKRNLQYKNGLLFVIDGSTGIRKAIEESFGNYAFVQRCIWHKRKNILDYLSEKYHDEVKQKYHRALNQSTYKEAKSALLQLIRELNALNKSAARSLEEGLEELLTLHKLELNEKFSASFSTTNCIENLNSQLGKYIGKVKYWKNSDERYRWIAAALLYIEKRMRKVDNFKRLKEMKQKIQSALKIKQTKNKNQQSNPS